MSAGVDRMKANLAPISTSSTRSSSCPWQPASFDYHPLTRVVFGPGTLSRLGELVRELGGTRVLLVTDPGLEAAGHPLAHKRLCGALVQKSSCSTAWKRIRARFTWRKGSHRPEERGQFHCRGRRR